MYNAYDKSGWEDYAMWVADEPVDKYKALEIRHFDGLDSYMNDENCPAFPPRVVINWVLPRGRIPQSALHLHTTT
jgi:hypothetical protein